ncbi:MAG: proline racemase family protein [Thermoplasmata archaeon]
MNPDSTGFGRVRVIDSHTAGEPTRVVVEGGPDLGQGSLAERRDRLQMEFDWFRSSVINEPRGSDAVVGALVGPPHDPGCEVGVVFFNNVGYLGMCGHGTIGLVTTLAYRAQLKPGPYAIETPVGRVDTVLRPSGEVSFQNVLSYRTRHDVEVRVPTHGPVRGDIAWGGNWFFLVDESPIELIEKNIGALTKLTGAIHDALSAQGIAGEGGAPIDHIELSGPPINPANSSRNFVRCPGGAYDRSPCGTGTSAKLACLTADGTFRPGQVWRQESILGTVFEARVSVQPSGVIPEIIGRAYVTGESVLVFDPQDPFVHGIRVR